MGVTEHILQKLQLRIWSIVLIKSDLKMVYTS